MERVGPRTRQGISYLGRCDSGETAWEQSRGVAVEKGLGAGAVLNCPLLY